MFQLDYQIQNKLQNAYVLQEKIYKKKKMLLCKIRLGKPLTPCDLNWIEKYMITF
jgi:hypothetical protein